MQTATTIPDFQQMCNIFLQNALPRRLSPGHHCGAYGALRPPHSSWETLGHALAEGPTELRAPGPRDPTIRHCRHGRMFGAISQSFISVAMPRLPRSSTLSILLMKRSPWIVISPISRIVVEPIGHVRPLSTTTKST